MYKKQLTFQKIVCLLCVIAAAIMFLYGLGLATDLHDSLRFTIRNPSNPDKTQVPGSRIFYDMQGINRQLVIMCLVMILLACLLYLTNTHCRRKYYIGNYAAIAIFTGAMVYVGIWAHQGIELIKYTFQTTVDFDALKTYSETMQTPYMGPDDTFWFDLHYVVVGLGLLAAVLLVANMIWKIRLMGAEKKLIKEGEEAAFYDA